MLASLLSHSVISDSLRPHGLQHARLPYPPLSPSGDSRLKRMLKLMSTESVMPSNHVIPSSAFIFPSRQGLFQ